MGNDRGCEVEFIHPELIKRFRRRVATESVWELRRHPERIRLALLVFYCVPRETDRRPLELLLEITHRITVKSPSQERTKGVCNAHPI
jgi:hypothetical protein